MPGPCSHKIDGIACGKPGVAAIKIRQGNIHCLGPKQEDMGRGVGSLWIVVCDQHIASYPDHEGMFLGEKQ